jgi:hypothetical protein
MQGYTRVIQEQQKLPDRKNHSLIPHNCDQRELKSRDTRTEPNQIKLMVKVKKKKTKKII